MKRSFFLLLLLFSAIVMSAQQSATKDSIAGLVPRGNEVFRWGYSELTSDQDKALYDTILGSLIRFDDNNFSPYYYHRCDLTGVPNTMDIQQVIAWLSRLSNDIPELYILSSTIPRYDTESYLYYARIGYVNSPSSYLSELLRLQEVADTLMSDICPEMTDYERLLLIHDRFIEWGDYGDLTGADAGNIRGALLNRRAVCEGFARAGLYLCQRAGIPCVFVSGQMLTSTVNETWENHAWNFVQLDGQWYLMDLTSDGGFPNIVGHDAFVRGAAYFNQYYRFSAPDGTNPNLTAYHGLPVLASDDYTPGQHDDLQELEQDISIKKVLIDGHLYLRTSEGIFSLSGHRIY